MPPKYFIITKHAIERFDQRLGWRREGNVKKYGIEKSIRKELSSYKKIKYIIDIDEHKYIFLKNGKEFRFKKERNTWVLLTVVRHCREEYHERVNTLRQLKGLEPIDFII